MWRDVETVQGDCTRSYVPGGFLNDTHSAREMRIVAAAFSNTLLLSFTLFFYPTVSQWSS